jgi:hypothetical protein
VDTVVRPEYRSRGIGGQLIEARYDLIRALNMRGLVAGSLIMDYHTVADHMSAEEYVRQVEAGTLWDTNLSKQLRKGFRVRGLIPDYSEFAPSLNWGVCITWENPDYRPSPTPVKRVAVPRRYVVPNRRSQSYPLHKSA